MISFRLLRLEAENFNQMVSKQLFSTLFDYFL